MRPAASPELRVGQLVVLADHINQMGWNPLIGPNEPRFAFRPGAGLRFFDMTEAYSKELRALAQEAAQEEGFALEEGVYLATPGPSFETPAEIRAFRALGATLVGMSTVPETIVARHMGIEVLGISCVTNLAAGLGATPLSHEEVNETGRRWRTGWPGCSNGWRPESPQRWKRTVSRPGSACVAGNVAAAALSAHGGGHCRLLRLGQDHAGQRAGPPAARPALSSRRLLSRPFGYPLAERVEKNFDDPALIEIPLLAEHVAALARGESIERPVYDFATYTRVRGRTQRVNAGPFLIVEGIFALYYPELLPHYHLRVYIDTPEELCFERRLKRDMEERGRTPESVRYQYEYRVRPSSLAFVRPSAANADLIVDGTGALDWKVERVMTELRKRGLLAGAG